MVDLFGIGKGVEQAGDEAKAAVDEAGLQERLVVAAAEQAIQRLMGAGSVRELFNGMRIVVTIEATKVK